MKELDYISNWVNPRDNYFWSDSKRYKRYLFLSRVVGWFFKGDRYQKFIDWYNKKFPIKKRNLDFWQAFDIEMKSDILYIAAKNDYTAFIGLLKGFFNKHNIALHHYGNGDWLNYAIVEYRQKYKANL